MNETDLKRSPLHRVHVELGARMTPFAGYDMPLQFADGILAEHTWVREHAGVFDVSHMGAVFLGEDNADNAAAMIETLVCSDIAGLESGQGRYTLLLNDDGCIVDDLIVFRLGDGRLYAVLNAARVEIDLARIGACCPRLKIDRAAGSALIAVQGPKARQVLTRSLHSSIGQMGFMSAQSLSIGGAECVVSCSGYTGEDGFEILIPPTHAYDLVAALLEQDEVRPIGLGARDSLRLEAGLCLYGQDIDETTSPIEAGLAWCVSRSRRQKKDFPGAGRIVDELSGGPKRRRVGLTIDSRVPARSGASIGSASGEVIGKVTSGGPGPSVGRPVAMGYVASHAASKKGTSLQVRVRQRWYTALVTPMPFYPHRYWRSGS